MTALVLCVRSEQTEHLRAALCASVRAAAGQLARRSQRVAPPRVEPAEWSDCFALERPLSDTELSTLRFAGGVVAGIVSARSWH
jgi:hypothetical protein